jgi:hypothetical protein
MITPIIVSNISTTAIAASSGIIVFIVLLMLSYLIYIRCVTADVKKKNIRGTDAVGSVNRKFGFTHYLYTLCCHGNTDISYIKFWTADVKKKNM